MPRRRARLPGDAGRAPRRRRRPCSSRSSAPGPRAAGAPRRDPRGLRRDALPRQPARAPSVRRADVRLAATTPSRSSARSSSSSSRQLRTGQPRRLRELEPVIERLILGALEQPRARDRRGLAALEAAVVECRRCPRLVAWREQVAREKRAAFADEDYWGRPVPGFGDPRGARRSSSAWRPPPTAPTAPGACSPATARATSCSPRCTATGFANQPTSIAAATTACELRDAWITAAVRCAPPANKPHARPSATPACPGPSPSSSSSTSVRVVVCLGAFAWDAALRLRAAARRAGPAAAAALRPRGGPRGRAGWPLLGCFHPSQQNTFTGKLTRADARRGLSRARRSSLSRHVGCEPAEGAGAARVRAGRPMHDRARLGVVEDPRSCPVAVVRRGPRPGRQRFSIVAGRDAVAAQRRSGRGSRWGRRSIRSTSTGGRPRTPASRARPGSGRRRPACGDADVRRRRSCPCGCRCRGPRRCRRTARRRPGAGRRGRARRGARGGRPCTVALARLARAAGHARRAPVPSSGRV